MLVDRKISYYLPFWKFITPKGQEVLVMSTVELGLVEWAIKVQRIKEDQIKASAASEKLYAQFLHLPQIIPAFDQCLPYPSTLGIRRTPRGKRLTQHQVREDQSNKLLPAGKVQPGYNTTDRQSAISACQLNAFGAGNAQP